jgi:hypothetical protein
MKINTEISGEELLDETRSYKIQDEEKSHEAY